MYNEYKDVIISLSNLLYKIELDERDKILLCKSIRKNRKMLQTMKISKKEFDINMMNLILEVLQYKYTVIDKKPMWVLVSKSKEMLKISQFSKR